jgi:acyl carrier protein|tara:strand:+ start:30 stop:263 length:234 start_codon:yes stop_codon:yes gene_type:complete
MKNKLNFNSIIELISKICNIEKKKINKNSNILDIEEWDSMANVRIFLEIDKKFHIKLRPENVENFKTIGDFYSFLSK